MGGGGEAVECNGSQREWLVGSVLLKFCHAFHCVNSKVLKVSLRQLDALLSDTCKVICEMFLCDSADLIMLLLICSFSSKSECIPKPQVCNSSGDS